LRRTIELRLFKAFTDFSEMLYSKARPNRFAGQISKDRLIVLLDPDVSEIFTTPEAVNAVLRALITTMPGASKRKASRK